MRIVALTDKPDSAYGWWRVARPLTALAKHGVDTEIGWLTKDDKPTASIKDSIVILQRVLLKDGLLEYAETFIQSLRNEGAKHIVYELDDDSFSLYYVQYLRESGRIAPASIMSVNKERDRVRYLMGLCDSVTVTTHKLAQLVRSYIQNKQVWVLPNLIDANWYLQHKEPLPDDEYVRIGWAGGLRPAADFMPMAEAWANIAEQYPQVRFVVAGYQPEEIYSRVDLDKIERRVWAPLTGWPTNMQVDIGCCALAPTNFNLYKSPIKWMEFTLSGAAVICSETMYGQHITDDEAIIIPHNTDSWTSALEALVDSASERAAYRESAVDSVLNKHNLAMNWQLGSVKLASLGLWCCTHS